MLEARLASNLREALLLRADLAIGVCATRVEMIAENSKNPTSGPQTQVLPGGRRVTHVNTMDGLRAALSQTGGKTQ